MIAHRADACVVHVRSVSDKYTQCARESSHLCFVSSNNFGALVNHHGWCRVSVKKYEQFNTNDFHKSFE